MLTDAARKFEEGVRRLGSAIHGFGERANEALETIADGFADLRNTAAVDQDPPPKRGPRPRSLPEPSEPVSELDRARAERELKKRGILEQE